MGCNCGKNKQTPTTGRSASYSPPAPPPTPGPGMAGPGAAALSAGGGGATEWYRVDQTDPQTGEVVDRVYWPTLDAALAFSAGQWAITRTTEPPPGVLAS